MTSLARNEGLMLWALKRALQVLSDRLLTLITFLVVAGAGGWAMADPNPHRDGIAAGFGLLYLLTLRSERRPIHHEQPVLSQDTENHDE